MADDFEAMVLRRLDRMETMAGSHYSPPDQSSEIEKLRGELAALKADVRNRDIEIRDLRAIVSSKVGPADVAATINKHIPKHVETIADFVSDAVIGAEKTLRNEIGDATRSISRDVERAEVAASSNLKSAAAVIAAWSSELGS